MEREYFVVILSQPPVRSLPRAHLSAAGLNRGSRTPSTTKSQLEPPVTGRPFGAGRPGFLGDGGQRLKSLFARPRVRSGRLERCATLFFVGFFCSAAL